MADDRIDVEITDKIDGNIDKKITAIDTSAKKAHSSVQLLRKELASIRANSLNQLTSALNQSSAASLKSASAKNTTAAASSKATAQLAKEAAQTERLAAVVERAAQREQAAAARRAATQRTGALGGATGSRATAARQTDIMRGTPVPGPSPAELRAAAKAADELSARIAALKASTDPLGSAMDRTNAELREAEALYRSGAISAADYGQAQTVLQQKLATQATAQQAFNARLGQTRGAMKLTASESLNLSRQFADIGVSAAMGMNPLMILIQQGPQIADVFTTARARGVGFGTALRGLVPLSGAALVAVGALAVGVAALAVAFKNIKDDAASDAEMKKYAQSLGLTRQEMKKLEDVTVTYGDVAKATFQVLLEKVGISTDGIKQFFSDAFDFITQALKVTIAFFIGGWVGGYRAIIKTWKMFPAALGDLFVQAVNLAIAAIESLANAAINSINFLTQGANQVLPDSFQIPEIAPASLKRVENQWAGAASNVASVFTSEIQGAYNEALAGMDALGAEISNRATDLAKKRIAAQAKEIIADRPDKAGKKGPKGKVDKTAENRAKALAEVNRELNRELQLMGLVGPAREIEARYTQIVNSLTDKGITLSRTEAQAIRDKVTALVDLTGVQQQLEKLYGELIQPQEDNNNLIRAANELLESGKISQEQYARAVANSARAAAEAADPFLAMKEAQTDENALLGKYGRELAIAAEVQQRYNALKAIDASITTAALPGIEAEVRALTRKRELQEMMNAEEGNLMAAAQATQQTEFLIANYERLYARINELRADDVLSEAGAMAAKADLDDRYRRARLTNEMTMLDALASLQTSGNKKLAMIGKAAAMTQATIDGVLAVQKALSAYPPPMNFVMAAIVGATAAANVAKIAGFERGGYTGNGGRKEMAGVVHGKEFVMNADATMRNRPLLDALNRGASVAAAVGNVQQPTREPGSAGGGSNAGTPGKVGSGNTPVADRVKIVNVIDPREALAAFDTHDGETLLVNMIERNANSIGKILGSR